jgi:type IV pilus secretin PilQ/predicted competence protein
MEKIHKTGWCTLAIGMVCLALTAGCTSLDQKRRPTPQPSEPPVAIPESAVPLKAASPNGVRYASNEEPMNPALRMPVEPISTSTVSGGGSVSIKVSDSEKVATPMGAPSSAPMSSSPPPPPRPDGSDASVRILPPPGGELPVTLHVDDADIHKALEIISRQANVSIIVSPGLTGKVTVDFQNMPLRKALNAIARVNNAEVQEKDGILFISTVKEARTIEAFHLPVRIYTLKYARAADMVLMIKPLLSSEGGAKTSASPDSKVGLIGTTASVSQTGGIGSTGDIQAGGNSNSGGEYLVVSDYEEVLKRVDAAVAEMDIQPIQVVIEAIIVQVTLTHGMDLGASFGLVDASGRALGVLGDGALINAATGFTPATVVTAAGKMVSGFSGDTYGLKYGFVSNNVTGFIQALETAGEVKVLATPRICVLNKQSGQVLVGKMLGYQTTTTTTTSTSATVNYMSVGTQLRIRPFVNDDGVIRMEVHPERSSGVIDSNGIPQPFVTQETSNVLMHDGQTMVIGGLIDNENDQTSTGLPFLSDIPWIGFLFRHTTTLNTKNELVVILTPRICPRDNLAAYNGLEAATLGLDKRVSHCPVGEKRDSKNLYELLQQQTCNPPAVVPPCKP